MDWHALYELFKFAIPYTIAFLIGILVLSTMRRSGEMPVAVITNNISDQIPLTTLDGGYVVVRRMTYGESLARSAKATKLLVGGDNTKNKDFQGEIDIQTEAIALWDFANLVVEHNLTDETERPLNFKNVADVKRLSASVGEEIGKIIDEFNDAENSVEVKNS